jgi:hypothetical protein
MKSWILEVEQHEDGEYYIQLTDEILEGSGFKIGDTFDWINNGDGSFTLTKKEETELVMVECISTFRQRYVVEVPKGKKDWALDTVTCEQAKEFSQLHIGETIVSHRVVSKEEVLEICDIDNHYCQSWSDEQKISAFVTLESDLKHD